MNLANIAATNMEHLCNCPEHGYSQSERWGSLAKGSCFVECEGHTSEFYKGDRDCVSSCADAWQEALIGTPYEGALDGMTNTYNARQAALASGLFEWHDMSFTAQRGDLYLFEGDINEGTGHMAMCLSDVPDLLGEFCISENATIYGESGDQTGGESHVAYYYDYPWDGILHFVGTDASSWEPSPLETIPDIDSLAYAVIRGEYGNGDERRERLGDLYDQVQARVNELL